MAAWIRFGVLLASMSMLSGCVRSGFGSASAGAGDAAHDGPSFLDALGILDGAPDSPTGDLSGPVDLFGPVDSKGLNCTAKTPDGLFLNPGCDPDVLAGGFSVVANAPIGMTNRWGVFRGAKWWIYDPSVLGGQGAFVSGGKSLSTLLMNSPPNCTATTRDGLKLNPGCDPDVKANGFTSMVTFEFFGAVNWLVCHGKKWWVFDTKPDAGPPAFVEGGTNLATFLTTQPPDCSYKTKDGTAMNPGCDSDVKANGFTTMGMMYDQGDAYWFAAAGKKWWLYAVNSDAGLDAFVAGGANISDYLLQFAPGCAAKTKDGLFLNPGCDLDVKSKGPTDLDVIKIFGKTQALVTYNKKWWLYDLSANSGIGAFVTGGKDVAAFVKGLKP